MVKLEKSIRLMGVTITVTEKYEGEFEEQRIFMEENKQLFKHKGNCDQKPTQRIICPKPKFPDNVMEAIRSVGGTNLVFLMAKKLEESDVDRFQNRLYVPKSKTLLQNLTLREIEQIEKNGREGGLEVIAIDQRGETYSLTMKMWQSSGSSNKYVLIKEWAKLVKHNKLQRGDLVEIWCLRVGAKLRLAVYARKRETVDLELRLG